jgi:tetratricopeptide (TPR) repeat protein
VYRDLGKLDESNSYLSEALDLSKSTDNHQLVADVYNLLGSVELRKGNHSQSISFYNRSLEIREEIGYHSSVASTLENLSRVYLNLNQYDESVKLLHKAISIRERLNDYRNLATAQNDLGNVYSQKGELAEALKHYLNSLKIRREFSLNAEVARSLTNIGITYRKLNSHKNALKYFEEALSLVSSETDPIGKSYIYIHVGNTQRDMDMPSKALDSYLDALELRRDAGNEILVAQALRSVASAHTDMENFVEAKKMLQQSLSLFEKIADNRGIADINNELGNVLLIEGNLEHALVYFENAAGLFGKLFDMDRRGLCLRKIGEVQLKLGRYNIAAENLNLALNIANSIRNGKLIETTLLSLYEFHFAKGEFKEALHFYRKHIEIRDSLQAIHTKEAVWQASLDLELDKKASEIRAIEGEVDFIGKEGK